MTDKNGVPPLHVYQIQRCECGSAHFDMDEGAVVCYDCGNIPPEIDKRGHYSVGEMVQITAMDDCTQVHQQRMTVTGTNKKTTNEGKGRLR